MRIRGELRGKVTEIPCNENGPDIQRYRGRERFRDGAYQAWYSNDSEMSGSFTATLLLALN